MNKIKYNKCKLIKKTNASIRLVKKFKQLINQIKCMSETKFKQPKINNAMINKAFNLLKSQDARYLNLHSTIAYNLYNTVDTFYLDVDYIYHEFNYVYAYKNNLELSDNVFRYLKNRTMNCSIQAHKQLIKLCQQGYKYVHFTYGKSVTANNKINDNIYANIIIPSKSLILKVINDMKHDASLAHIINIDLKALKINVKTEKQLYHHDLTYLTQHNKHQLQELNKDKQYIKRAQLKLQNFDTSYPF